MNKIISYPKAIDISTKLKNKKIVLVGGCFDILHVGHIKFLENAKKSGEILFVLLESDKTVSKIKGKNRPINNQMDRALILASLNFTDYIVLLDELKNNNEYDNLVKKINPNIIAVTKNDKQIVHNMRQAKLINAKVQVVTNRLKDKSSTKLARLISKYF